MFGSRPAADGSFSSPLMAPALCLYGLFAAVVSACVRDLHSQAASWADDIRFWMACVAVYAGIKAVVVMLERGLGLACHSPWCRPVTCMVLNMAVGALRGFKGCLVATGLVAFLPHAWLLFPSKRVKRKLAARTCKHSQVKRKPAAQTCKASPVKKPAALSEARLPCFTSDCQKLRQWVAKHGGQWPQRTSRNQCEKQLAAWVNNRRQDFRMERLLAAEAAELEKIPGWTYGAVEGNWYERFAELEQLFYSSPYSKESPCAFYPSRKPPSFLDEAAKESEIGLARWVANQKFMESHGRLSKEHREALQELPQWAWTTHVGGAQQQKEREWAQWFADLERWPSHPENVRTDAIPSRFSGALQGTPHEGSLAGWFQRQLALLRIARQHRKRLCRKTSLRKHGQATMSQNRIQHLMGYLSTHNLMQRGGQNNAPPPSGAQLPAIFSHLSSASGSVPIDLD